MAAIRAGQPVRRTTLKRMQAAVDYVFVRCTARHAKSYAIQNANELGVAPRNAENNIKVALATTNPAHTHTRALGVTHQGSATAGGVG